jgi:hypothetical protein
MMLDGFVSGDVTVGGASMRHDIDAVWISRGD